MNVSDVMLFGVLRMPYELAMSDELSRRQCWSHAAMAADRIESDEAELTRLRSLLANAYVIKPMVWSFAMSMRGHEWMSGCYVVWLYKNSWIVWCNNSYIGEHPTAEAAKSAAEQHRKEQLERELERVTV